MNRAGIKEYIKNVYGIEPDFPWIKYPSYMVFRHASNKKWFAVVMSVPKNKLGLAGDEVLDVVNLKCEPIFWRTDGGGNGIFPAYHMNKSKWITVTLDGSVSDEEIKMLLDISFELTALKCGKKMNK